ncbi:MAG: bacillithiol biosynthesis BshC, partial [Gemmatimonas sp.]
PVFWAATDDSDWEEASVTYVLTMRGLQILRPASARTDGIAMMDVPLGDVTEALAALRGASGSAPHQHMLDEVASAYVPHATVGAAYLQLLRALLEPLGIAVLDASHPALRAAADPFLRRALGKSAAIAEQLKERTASIRAAGFEPQVETMDALSLVFQSRIGSTGRQQERIRERVSVADAARVAREAEVGTLGPNVLLRPVLERHLLPTMAYVAGPGEYAYFAQVAPVANAIGASQPLALPRWAGEVIETRSNRLRERLGISEADLRDPHAVETELARAALPEDAQDALERLRVTLETQTMALRAAVAADDGLVHPAVVDGLHRDFTHRLERFERRVVGGVKRREDTLMREIAHVRAAFQPLGTSPERVLNLMPVLARHGNAVFDLMQTAARPYSESIVHGLPHVPSSTG